MMGLPIRGWNPILSGYARTSMALFSTNLQERASGLLNELGQPTSARIVTSKYKSAARLCRWLSELPWDCATATARRGMGPRCSAGWAPAFLPMGQGGAEALWIALPNYRQAEKQHLMKRKTNHQSPTRIQYWYKITELFSTALFTAQYAREKTILSHVLFRRTTKLSVTCAR